MGAAGLGRPSKPTNLKVLHGDRPDRINRQEPLPEPKVVMPGDLSTGAKKVWKRLAPDLQKKGVLTSWDIDEFASFCDAVARHAEARKQLDKEGEVVESPVFNRNGEMTGYRKELSKWWQVWKGANEAMLRYGARFGMSPSDRSQLSIGGNSDGQGADLLS
jgi:P27 family predicted phage terminase small subunit